MTSVTDGIVSTGTRCSTPSRIDQRLARRQVEQGADGLTRAFERPHLEPLRHREQEHDAGAFEPLAERHGAGDGNDHQRVDVDRAGPKGGERPPGREDGAGRRWPRRAGRRPGPDAQSGWRPAPAQNAGAGGRVSQNRHRTSAPEARGLLVLEPHPHARLTDGIDHRGRRQLGGVVLDVQPLPDDVGRQAPPCRPAASAGARG